MNRRMCALLVGLTLIATTGCSSSTEPRTCLDLMSVGPSTVTLTATGSNADLDASYSGCDEYRADELFTWSSSDLDVATVDDQGVVTAVGEGTAEITALLTEEAAGAEFATEPSATVRVTVTAQ